MVMIPYVADPRHYEEVFLVQTRNGPLIWYRGLGLQNGSGLFPQISKDIFSSIAGFAKPVVRRAVPHAKAVFSAARPHLQNAATDIFRETSLNVSDAINRKLNSQDGGSIRERRKSYGKGKKAKRLRRTAPKNISNFIQANLAPIIR